MSCEANVTEKPILFSAPMVRAILAGRKTQTRRLLRYQCTFIGKVLLSLGKLLYMAEKRPRDCLFAKPAPYSVGDRLWVKETSYVAPVGFGDRNLCNATDYDGQRRVVGYLAGMDDDSERCATDYGVKKSPAIFMPWWASRITLDVTAVRVERLQEITQEDAIAVGVGELGWIVPRQREREAFSELWDSINAKRATWASNPWVCVVSFKLAARRAPGEEG